MTFEKYIYQIRTRIQRSQTNLYEKTPSQFKTKFGLKIVFLAITCRHVTFQLIEQISKFVAHIHPIKLSILNFNRSKIKLQPQFPVHYSFPEFL